MSRNYLVVGLTIFYLNYPDNHALIQARSYIARLTVAFFVFLRVNELQLRETKDLKVFYELLKVRALTSVFGQLHRFGL